MSQVKNAVLDIRTCELCYGKGVIGWVAPDGDFDFEFCSCNPFELILDENEVI